MRKIWTGSLMLLVGVMLQLFALQAAEKPSKFDEAMGPIVTEYLVISSTLASDQTAGVQDSARKIAALASRLDPATAPAAHAAHYKDLPRNLAAAANDLAKAKEITSMRAAFKALSRPLAMWASMSRTAGLNVVYCPMAKGSWLQKEKAVRNPYYGKDMLTCGQIVSGPNASAASGEMSH